MFREDFLIRMIQQVAEALRRLMGQRERGEYDAALRTSGELYDELTTMPREMTDAMDTASFARLLGSAEKIRTMAMLCWEEGRIYAGKGDPIVAHARYCRAHELFLEARAIDRARAGGGAGGAATDDDSAILELSRVAPARDLAARYRGVPSRDDDDDGGDDDGGDAHDPAASGDREEIPSARVVKDTLTR